MSSEISEVDESTTSVTPPPLPRPPHDDPSLPLDKKTSPPTPTSSSSIKIKIGSPMGSVHASSKSSSIKIESASLESKAAPKSDETSIQVPSDAAPKSDETSIQVPSDAAPKSDEISVQVPAPPSAPRLGRSFRHYQISALLITYGCSLFLCSCREPFGIVKSTIVVSWEPFRGTMGIVRLGELDLAYMFSFAVGTFYNAFLGDHLSPGCLLRFGMLCTTISTLCFGIGFWVGCHEIEYYLVFQMLSGWFQSICWLSLMKILDNWCSDENGGLMRGMWSSSSYFGSFIGSFFASVMLNLGWGWSFLLPSIFLFLAAMIGPVFLVVSPAAVGHELPTRQETHAHDEGREETSSLLPMNAEGLEVDGSSDSSDAGEVHCLSGIVTCILGQSTRCTSLALSRLVIYTFMFWLPYYLRHTAIAGVYNSASKAGFLSMAFSGGGIVGSVVAGYVWDKVKAPATIDFGFLVLSTLWLILYGWLGNASELAAIVLMFLSGVCVHGPYSFLSLAVLSDLGEIGGINRNLCEVAVSAILDGAGAAGAAMAGYFLARGWNAVYYVLVGSNVAAMLFLAGSVKGECAKRHEPEQGSSNATPSRIGEGIA